jgi:hypothetical protein
VGAYLARQSHLEAASVRAFADIHDDLRALGAPPWLLRAVRASAADEVRHARVCSELAARHGVAVAWSPVPAAPRRSLAQLARDNFVEGCIRETYGAVIGGYQARAGARPYRRALRAIARDEIRHADLSWQLHAWLWPQLDAGERASILAAGRAARAELELATADAPDLRAALGLPDDVAARVLREQLDAAMWTPAFAAA